MHEAALMTGLMRRINEAAAAGGAKRVVGVSVRLGALSQFSAAHFAEHFTRAAAGTAAENARLDVSQSEDEADPCAQDVVLERIEIET